MLLAGGRKEEEESLESVAASGFIMPVVIVVVVFPSLLLGLCEEQVEGGSRSLSPDFKLGERVSEKERLGFAAGYV